MPFADAMELVEDYRDYPPVHMLVAGYFGMGRKPAAEPTDGPPPNWPQGPVKGF